MTALHVELQDGWEGRPVEVRLDGSLLADLRPRTRYQIGLAEALEFEVEPGAHELEIVAGDLVAREELTVDAETWVGASLAADAIELRVQSAPFPYM
ncbi:hypothetical protein B5M43_010130 [Microbacterium sp. MEC084]|uniref:hypothetical protein n=1 Tax=unclassified Microbacterium TaxID=2609290 RepID=UPI0006FC0A2B|nr:MULTISPECIES: hypothetical protein [unclassified Microbacterium]KQY99169.1 hypothetical protein ASD19_04560 [Microbacterium sp. Root53]MCD1269193.1 hypothetical protein [Microbacterium sp. MEC084]